MSTRFLIILSIFNVIYFLDKSVYGKSDCIEIDSLRKIYLVAEVHDQKNNVQALYKIISECLLYSNDTLDLYLEMPKSEEIILNQYIRNGKIIHYDYPKKESQLYPYFNLYKYLRFNLSNINRVRFFGIDNEYDLGKIYASIFVLLENEILSKDTKSVLENMQINYSNVNFCKSDLIELKMMLKNQEEGSINKKICLDILDNYISDSLEFNNILFLKSHENYRDALMASNFMTSFSAKNISIINIGYYHVIDEFDGKKIGFLNFYDYIINMLPDNLNITFGIYSKTKISINYLKKIYSKEVIKYIKKNKRKNNCLPIDMFQNNNINSIL